MHEILVTYLTASYVDVVYSQLDIGGIEPDLLIETDFAHKGLTEHKDVTEHEVIAGIYLERLSIHPERQKQPHQVSSPIAWS
jgi:hypothetical protein